MNARVLLFLKSILTTNLSHYFYSLLSLFSKSGAQTWQTSWRFLHTYTYIHPYLSLKPQFLIKPCAQAPVKKR